MPRATIDRSAKNRPAISIPALIAFAVAALSPASSPAELIYSTSFEAPNFTAGQSVVGQDGWSARFGTAAGTIETDIPRSGQQYLRSAFSDLSPAPGNPGVLVEEFRRVLDYDAVANGRFLLSLSVDARLDGPLIGDDVVNAVFEAIPSDISSHGNPFGQFSISADGNLYVYGSRFEDFLVTGIELGRYYRLGFDLDFAARMTVFFLDGSAIASFPFADEIQSTILASANLGAVAVNDPALIASYTARFDDFSIAAIPEPVSWSILALGLPLLARRPRINSYATGSRDNASKRSQVRR